jgi:hypothetical protein
MQMKPGSIMTDIDLEKNETELRTWKYSLIKTGKSSDCGVHALFMAEMIALEKTDALENVCYELMPYLRVRLVNQFLICRSGTVWVFLDT